MESELEDPSGDDSTYISDEYYSEDSGGSCQRSGIFQHKGGLWTVIILTYVG